jgi:hypothetical protein
MWESAAISRRYRAVQRARFTRARKAPGAGCSDEVHGEVDREARPQVALPEVERGQREAGRRGDEDAGNALRIVEKTEQQARNQPAERSAPGDRGAVVDRRAERQLFDRPGTHDHQREQPHRAPHAVAFAVTPAERSKEAEARGEYGGDAHEPQQRQARSQRSIAPCLGERAAVCGVNKE